MNLLMCPVCREALSLEQRSWQCCSGHSYDIAKQGYVNLHLVQHKRSKTPGDTAESVQARRNFLEQGFYQPLQHAILQQLHSLNVKTLLDIGCGEGYYTHAMQSYIPHCIGLDISKSAVQRAAKLNSQIIWVVGTGGILPVVQGQIDICTSLFSPIPKCEILRVLKPNGYLLIARPGERHLYTMREALFDHVNLHVPDKFLIDLEQDFHLVSENSMDSELHLDQMQLKNLMNMTPYAYRAKPEKIKSFLEKPELHVEAHFQLYLFQKK